MVKKQIDQKRYKSGCGRLPHRDARWRRPCSEETGDRTIQRFQIAQKYWDDISKPLKNEGIDKISFRMEGGEETVVVKDESAYFEAPNVPEELIDEIVIEQSLQIVNIAFQENGKWRFSDGNAAFYADILDKGFIEKVQKNQAAFAKDDILKARLKRRQVIATGGIKTEYTILKIIEHRSAAITIRLPFVQ